MKPLSPREAIKQFKESIPPEVFECWNEELKEKLQISGKKAYATCRFSDISKRIQARLNVSSEEVSKKGWLELEDHFSKAGWEVTTDCPAYNESYPATVSFASK